MKTIETELVEVCPHCGHENHYYNVAASKCGYIEWCRECGKPMFLCDACLHEEDNPKRRCDWEEKETDGKLFSSCFRGEYVVED